MNRRSENANRDPGGRAGLTSEQIARYPTKAFLNWQRSLRVYEQKRTPQPRHSKKSKKIRADKKDQSHIEEMEVVPGCYPVELHQESMEDFLSDHFSEELSDIVDTIRVQLNADELQEDVDQIELLNKLYELWNESENKRVVKQCIPLLCLSLHLFPDAVETLIQQLLVGADQEYDIHKRVIGNIALAIRLFVANTDKLRILSHLILYLRHPSNEVRQLVVRIIGEFANEFPETIKPTLHRVIAEDPDREDVVRFARQFMRTNTVTGSIGTSRTISVTLKRRDQTRNLSLERHNWLPPSNPRFLRRLSLRDLCGRLCNLDEQTFAYEEYDILDILSERFYHSEDSSDQSCIVKAIAHYIRDATFPNILQHHACRAIGNVISNPRENSDWIQQIYEALIHKLGMRGLSWEEAQFTLNLLTYDSFDPMMIRTLENVVFQLNNSLFEHERLQSRVRKFCNHAFDIFFSKEWLQTDNFFEELQRLKGNNISIGIVLESLIPFIQSIASNISRFPLYIKKTAAFTLYRLAIQINHLPSQVAILELLNLIAMTSFSQELRRYVVSALDSLNCSGSIFPLTRVFLSLNGADHVINWSRVLRPCEISDRDWCVFVIQCEYKSRHYLTCIQLARKFGENYTSLSSAILWVEARAYRQIGQLDEALKSLRFLEDDWPFNPEVLLLQAEIFYLKRQVRRARKKIRELTEGHFPEFNGFSAAKLDVLARESEIHSVLIYQPNQAAINRIHEIMLSLTDLLNEDPPSLEVDSVFSRLIERLNHVFGHELIDQCVNNNGFSLDRLKKFEYPNERERFLRQFVEHCIRQQISHYYLIQYRLFESREAYDRNLLAQIDESKILSIYRRTHSSDISLENLLSKMIDARITVLPILEFIKRYATKKEMVGAFSLGISGDMASSYDTMVQLFGFQPWAMTYGEFNIFDIDDNVHTPQVMERMVRDDSKRPIVFFIPSGIGDEQNATGDVVTYNEIQWVMETLVSHQDCLGQFIFVFDAYNYLPYYLLSKHGEEIDPEDSKSALVTFIEEHVLEDEREIVRFRDVMKESTIFINDPTLYQKELLYDWIKIVSYSQSHPSDLDSLKLDALNSIRETLIFYFRHNNADQFVQEVIDFANTKTKIAKEKNCMREWIKKLVEHEDFADLIKLDGRHREALLQLRVAPLLPRNGVTRLGVFRVTDQCPADATGTSFDDSKCIISPYKAS